MSVIVKDDKEIILSSIKGAPDVLIARCESILWEGKSEPLNRESKERVQQDMNELSLTGTCE